MELVAYRCAAWETPFWLGPNREEGRYNRAGEAPTTYFGLHPLTPWAEYLRAQRCYSETDVLSARPPTWAVRVTLDPDEVVTLSFDDPDPLSADELVDDDYAACQAFAAGLRGDPTGPKAIIAPSAALPGTNNLILLAPRVLAPYLPEPIDPVIDTPGAPTAVRGRAPFEVAALVHHRGSGVRHAALAAWAAGDDFEFIEPTLHPGEVTGVAVGP